MRPKYDTQVSMNRTLLNLRETIHSLSEFKNANTFFVRNFVFLCNLNKMKKQKEKTIVVNTYTALTLSISDGKLFRQQQNKRHAIAFAKQ